MEKIMEMLENCVLFGHAFNSMLEVLELINEEDIIYAEWIDDEILITAVTSNGFAIIQMNIWNGEYHFRSIVI